METALSRRTRLVLIIAALVLHVSLLLFLARHRFQFISKPSLIFFEEEKQQPENTWAARKAHASAFGVPVSFEEPPPPQPPVEAEKEHEQAQPEPQESQELVKPAQPEPTPQPTEKEENILEETQLTDAQKEKPISEEIQEQKKTQPEEKEHETPQIKKEPQNLQHMQQAMRNKQLTLAQLAQGFIEHLKNEGDSTVTVLGDENRQPTDEQLKHERYLERITWCLQKSYKINRQKHPPVRPDQTNMELYLALNKDGSIRDLKIVTSSGIKSLDEFALFVFRDASSEFPPLPVYLPHDPYTVVFVVQFIPGAESGFSMSMH